MLPKIHRLTQDRDFKRVFKTGTAIEDRLLRIKFSPNQKSISRFGFVVSIKTARRAHERNLTKRRLRHVARFLLPSLKPGFDIVVWPKAKELKFSDLAPSLKDLIKKTPIWSKK